MTEERVPFSPHGLRVYQHSPFFYVSGPPFIPALHLQTFRLVTLNIGKVWVTGGYVSTAPLASTELYDPATGTWLPTVSMNVGRFGHTATLLNNSKMMVAGGETGSSYLASAELGTLLPGNTFTSTLTLPSEWLSNTAISAQLVGNTSAAAINAGALSNDNNTWCSWIAATSDVTTITTWNVSGEGANKPVYLRLRDVNYQVATVVTGTVNVDLTSPTSTMTALPATSPANISLSWSGSDALSGVSTYDVQYYRAGSALFWIDWLTDVTTTSASFAGQDSQTYGFRVRARDNAGNVGAYSSDDILTTVDTTPPTPGDLTINGGALSATAITVTLSLLATDATGGVAMMNFSNDGSAWSTWQPYATSASWSLLSGDGLKTVYARFRDVAGNVSSPVSNTIALDTAAGAEYGATINEGALFTNQTAVILTISARPGTAQMQVSNDGGFAGAQWEPYTSHKAWAITQYGSYVIPRLVYVRYKDLGGNVSSNYQDDIILDMNPPTGSVEIVGAMSSYRQQDVNAQAARPSFDNAASNTYSYTVYLPLVVNSFGCPPTSPANVTLRLSAQDDVSGVADMLISNAAGFNCATWEPYATTKAWYVPQGSTTTVHARFRDNAGNVSETVTDTISR